MKRHCGIRLGNQVGASGAGDEGHEPRLKAALGRSIFRCWAWIEPSSGRVPHVRTSVHGTKKTGRSPFQRSCHAAERQLLKGLILVTHRVKAFEKNRYRPMYAGANMGHPSTVFWKRTPLGSFTNLIWTSLTLSRPCGTEFGILSSHADSKVHCLGC